MLRRMQIAVAVAAVLLVSGSAAAQATCGNTNATTASCTPGGTSVSVTVEKIVRLTVTPTTASLTAPTDANFTSGGTANVDNLNLQALVVRANVAWELEANADAWTAPYAKAIADASFSTDGGTNWTAFDGNDQSLATGSATAATTVNLSYRISWSLANDIPGTYTLPVAFIISST